MKILAINGSPRGASGNTDVLVQAFLAGARQAGAITDTVYLCDQVVHYCSGCFSCWTRTPGICVHEDDMAGLLERMRSSDVVVIASPLYGNMLTGQMKTFLDRTLPLSHPAILKMGDEYLHPPRYADGSFRIVVISNAGFPQTHHFDGLKKTFEISTSGPRAKLAGMICCAPGPLLTMPGAEQTVGWYLQAVGRAGQEVVHAGEISAMTQAALDRSLTDNPGEYADRVNAYWQRAGVQSVPSVQRTPSTEIIPLEASRDVSSVRDVVSRLPLSFSPQAAGTLSAVIQFDIPDEDPGIYHVVIRDGVCLAFEGAHPDPQMVIHSPAQVWMDVCAGRVGGAAAYMSGQYQVSGNTLLLMRFASLFRS